MQRRVLKVWVQRVLFAITFVGLTTALLSSSSEVSDKHFLTYGLFAWAVVFVNTFILSKYGREDF